MPKIDPREFFTDKTKYPDDMEFALPNGDVISVGEYRNQLGLKSEFTRHTEQASARARELEGHLQTSQQNLSQAIERAQQWQTEAESRAIRQAPPQGQTPEELMADPYVGAAYREARKATEELQKFREEQGARNQFYEQTWQRERFAATIDRLRGKDPELDVDGFLKFSQRKPVIDVESKQVDLDATYRNFAHDRLIGNAVKDAEARGIEKGKQAARVPRVPFGRRSAPASADAGPANFRDVKVADVLNDTDLMTTLTGPEE